MEYLNGNQSINLSVYPTGLYDWMRVLAGGKSKFQEIEMVGPIYDKNGKEISGATSAAKNSMYITGANGLTTLQPLERKEIVFSGGTFTPYNTGTTEDTCRALSAFRWQTDEARAVMINVNFDFKVESPTETIVELSFQPNTGVKALGAARVKLPPSGQSFQVSITFLVTSWPVGGYVGNFFIENTSSLPTPVLIVCENAQSWSEIQAPVVV